MAHMIKNIASYLLDDCAWQATLNGQWLMPCAGLGTARSRRTRSGAQGGPGERPAGARAAAQRHVRLAALLRGAPHERSAQGGCRRVPAAAAAAALARIRGWAAPGFRVEAARGAALDAMRAAARAARVAGGGHGARNLASAAGGGLQDAREGVLLHSAEA